MAARKKKVKKKPARRKPETKKRRGRGQPPFQPTEDQRKQVELMVGLNLTHREIASLVFNPRTGKGISVNTLELHFRYELDNGAAKVNAKVGESLVKRALDLQHPQGATCAIFYAKTRMGWKETQVHEVESKAGVLVAPAQMTPEEWIEQQQKADAEKEAPE